MLFYQRGAEGDNVPETIIGRGPTTEPLVVEVSWITLLFLHYIYIYTILKQAANSKL